MNLTTIKKVWYKYLILYIAGFITGYPMFLYSDSDYFQLFFIVLFCIGGLIGHILGLSSEYSFPQFLLLFLFGLVFFSRGLEGVAWILASFILLAVIFCLREWFKKRCAI